jgi:hypothetical protein
MIAIEGNGMMWTIAMTKHLDSDTKHLEIMLLCYDLTEWVTNEEEEILFTTKLNLFRIETIMQLELKIFSVIILDAKVDFKDLMFNFLHFEGHIQVDITPTWIKVQDLDIAR